MHLDRDIPLGQHDIWAPRKSLVVKPESKPPGMQGLAQLDLRLSILASDTCHHAGAGLLAYCISHIVNVLLR